MIIWIASYPKSGNTWVRSLLSSYLYTKDGIFNFSLLKKIDQFPNKKILNYFTNDYSNIKNISNYWIAAQDRLNLLNNNKTIFLKTHSALCTLENNSFTNANNTQAVIYVVRDPRNVITSISNHFSLDLEESYKFITNRNKIISGNDFSMSTVLGSWSDHYTSWSKIKFSPILVVKYENLISDTKNTLIKILNFLSKLNDVEINEKKIFNTVNSCSFENLSKMEKKEGFSEAAVSKKNNKKINFFYLGKKNDWKSLLKPEMEKKLRFIFNKEMKDLNYIKN